MTIVLQKLEMGETDMTLISFYDEDPLDNVGDILYFQPETCIFLGESPVLSNRQRNILTNFFEGRGIDIRIEYHCIVRGDIEEARSLLTQLVMEYPDCILDVSGGTEMLIAVAGYVAGKCDIPLYQRRGKNNEILWQLDCDLKPREVSLGIEEVVSLHSGMVLEAYSPPTAEEQLYYDIPLLWEVARQDPKEYNILCNALAFFMENSCSSDPLELVIPGSIYSQAEDIDPTLLLDLESAGLIEELKVDWGGLSLRFPSVGIRDILTKAGNLLEMVICMSGSFADDYAMGISMDWDGIDDPTADVQTKNELDVMLITGLVPICISCKFGDTDKTALYELDTVSRHFAGKYAKRILVASFADTDPKNVEYLRQRARDMNITPLLNIHNYTFGEIQKLLKKHCCR